MGTREVRGRVYVLVELEESETAQGADGDRKRVRHRIEYEKKFTPGTTDGTQLDRAWSTDSALTTTPTDVDVRGSLPSVLDSGQTVVLADVAIICIVSDEASGGDDAQLGAGTNPFTGMLASGDVATVEPQGILLWVAPFGVAAGAGASDVIRMVAGSNTADVRAILAGRSS